MCPTLPLMTNYFELFALKESFSPDAVLVKKKFYELSRQFHPDRFVSGGTEAMEEALKMSAIINKAYEILRDEDKLMAYILKLHCVIETDEKFNLAPTFLMEMMELNETINEAEMIDDDVHKQFAIESLQQHVFSLKKDMQPFIETFENGNHSKENLLALKDFFYQKKYLLRIQERIIKFALP
jgi:molecular chaperone HscB